MNDTPFRPVSRWLPEGKDAALCLSIDDVHPGRSCDDYDGGGDLGDGALGIVQWLLERHPKLRVTLFVTADWRERSPTPSRWLSSLPVLSKRLFLTPVLPAGTRRVDRAPAFVRYLSGLPRGEIAFHGLHHVHRGPLVHVEFQRESRRRCRKVIEEMERIFVAAGWPFARGMCPPGWNAPPALLQAMLDRRFDFVASARDIRTPAAPGARARMSGLWGVPLHEPAWVGEPSGDGPGLLHFTSNFQATSAPERAWSILDAGGLLAIKAHAIKSALGHVALDGVDQTYFNYLDLLLCELERRYGDRLWWTSMGAIADYVQQPEGVASPAQAVGSGAQAAWP